MLITELEIGDKFIFERTKDFDLLPHECEVTDIRQTKYSIFYKFRIINMLNKFDRAVYGIVNVGDKKLSYTKNRQTVRDLISLEVKKV